MVAINRIPVTEIKPRHVEGVSCPKCGISLPYPNVMTPKTDNYGRVTRQAFGWCFGCDAGYCMIHFIKDGKWIMHEYQKYGYPDQSGQAKTIGGWVKVNVMPLPAAVVTGPGGEYTKDIELNKMLENNLIKCTAVLNKAGKALCELMDIAKGNVNG